LPLLCVLLASCGDDEGRNEESSTGRTEAEPDPLDQAAAACERALDSVEGPHDDIGLVVPSTIRDIRRDGRMPEVMLAAWSEMEPDTPVAVCSFDWHECPDPLAISATQVLYVTGSDRVDFAEPEETDCNVYDQPPAHLGDVGG
jgi:hypothetical protein